MALPPRDFSTIGPREARAFRRSSCRISMASRWTCTPRGAAGGPSSSSTAARTGDRSARRSWSSCSRFSPARDRPGRALRRELRPGGGTPGLRGQAGHRLSLLSDEGSHVMRRLGLLNERVQEDHAAYGIKPDPRHTNLPYPGVFVLDEAGVIVAKRFHESYRERDTGAALLAQTLRVLEPRPPRAADFPGPSIVVGAWLDSPTYSFFQRMHLNLELRLAPGFRIGSPGASHGIAPLTVQVAETPGVVAGVAEWPDAEESRRAGQDGVRVDAWRHDPWPRASHLRRRSRSGRSRGDGEAELPAPRRCGPTPPALIGRGAGRRLGAGNGGPDAACAAGRPSDGSPRAHPPVTRDL